MPEAKRARDRASDDPRDGCGEIRGFGEMATVRVAMGSFPPGASKAAPHDGQKRTVPESGLPQAGQVMTVYSHTCGITIAV